MKLENRIKKSQEFQEILNKKKSVGCSSLVIYFQVNELKRLRVGISSGKRLGKAVIRNKTKRQVRALVKEIFDLDASLDLIIIVRNKFLDQTYEERRKDFKYLFKKINNELKER